MAASSGIEIVADTISSLSQRSESYDAIVACDIIEHVPDPLQFIRSLRHHIRPGGWLVITTGNFDAWLWRLTGARFWYCSFPEHISFIGKKWIQRVTSWTEMKLHEIKVFNYRGGMTDPFRLAMVAIHAGSPYLHG